MPREANRPPRIYSRKKEKIFLDIEKVKEFTVHIFPRKNYSKMYCSKKTKTREKE